MSKFYRGRAGVYAKVTYHKFLRGLKTQEVYVCFNCYIKAVDEADGIRQVTEWGEKIKQEATGTFAQWFFDKWQAKDTTIKPWNNVVSTIWWELLDNAWFVLDWRPFTVEISDSPTAKVYELSHAETMANFTTEEIFGE